MSQVQSSIALRWSSVSSFFVSVMGVPFLVLVPDFLVRLDMSADRVQDGEHEPLIVSPLRPVHLLSTLLCEPISLWG